MKFEYNCWFCKQPLFKTNRTHAGQHGFIYECQSCPTITEHLFYNNDKSLTLRTNLQFKDQSYILYLYPDHVPAVLLVNTTSPINKTIIKLADMSDWTSHN